MRLTLLNKVVDNQDCNFTNCGNHLRSMEFDELLKEIDKLPINKKQILLQKLLNDRANLIVILGNGNIINNSIAILNDSTVEELSKKLEKLPTDAIVNLLNSISRAIDRE